MQGTDGLNRLVLNDQWSPRVGVVWDPTQQGRSKIFANYGRYYENIPLDMAEPVAQRREPGRVAAHNCDPLQGYAGVRPEQLPGGVADRPSTVWSATPALRTRRRSTPTSSRPRTTRWWRAASTRCIPNARRRRELHPPEPGADRRGHVHRRATPTSSATRARASRSASPRPSARTTRSRSAEPRPSPTSGWPRSATPGRG